ncbi:metallophosphoesterase [Streptococcus massiliensis]|uniref:Serine/threonine protein phosphatase family protein n=1 Tax=Streptococcus massiliensis TaxID=313439 RepID=A0A380KW55_9STRE|nr:metallophosphoesterase [Streptococcus massiliensis]SUN76163.1 serine/threonine protein phosphatase family protein [Streptococcus massiliensis]
MTKLAIMSDLHIDSNQFKNFETEILIETLQAENIQHLHLAGDISNDFYRLSQDFLQTLNQHFELSFNIGNHDMLGMTENQIRSQEFSVKKFPHFSLVSFTGWYDYTFVPTLSEEQHLKNKQLYWFDRRLERVGTDKEITERLLRELDEQLKQIEGPIILATHFVPHERFTLQHPYFERFNAFLGSSHWHDLFRKYPITDVVFGHTHHRFPLTTIDGINYHCRPLGYQREWQLVSDFFKEYPQYQIDKMYHLPKRFKAIRDLSEFKTYKEKHLATEFKEALSTFEI